MCVCNAFTYEKRAQVRVVVSDDTNARTSAVTREIINSLGSLSIGRPIERGICIQFTPRVHNARLAASGVAAN